MVRVSEQVQAQAPERGSVPEWVQASAPELVPEQV
jgi:hypothetical protein